MFAPFGYGLDTLSNHVSIGATALGCHTITLLRYTYSQALRTPRTWLKFGREVAQSGPGPLRTVAIYSRGGLHALRFSRSAREICAFGRF